MIGDVFKMDEMKNLKLKANEIRKDIIEMAFKAQAPCHPAPALSCTDIVTALYFKFMKVRADAPNWEERDRFILSKGHACPVLYAALAEAGFFSKELFPTLRGFNSKLQGHPVYPTTPGVDAISGSLGNGIAIGAGMAYGLKLKGKNAKVFVIIGDGEMQEGLIWEAAYYAPNVRLGNLVVILDNNHLQSCGSTDQIRPAGSVGVIADKWRSFGWHTIEMNGNDMDDVVSKLEMACMYREVPTMIVAHTTKGKGVSFMEHNNDWHCKAANEEQYRLALQELDQTEHKLKEVR
jgi:transketolase